MTELVAILSTGKGTWGHVNRLVMDGSWEQVFFICNEFAKQNYNNEKNAVMIQVDSRKSLPELVEDIKSELKDKIKGTEVAVNLISGEGKEHMALISALLKLGLAIRFVALTKDGIKEI